MQTYANHELSELHILFGSPPAAWHVQTRQADADPPSRSHLGSDSACVVLTYQPWGLVTLCRIEFNCEEQFRAYPDWRRLCC